jgi:hypothetical protein
MQAAFIHIHFFRKIWSSPPSFSLPFTHETTSKPHKMFVPFFHPSTTLCHMSQTNNNLNLSLCYSAPEINSESQYSSHDSAKLTSIQTFQFTSKLTKDPFQSKCMHEHQDQTFSVFFQNPTTINNPLDSEANHQSNNTSQLHKFKFRALSVKFQTLSNSVRGASCEVQ